MKAYRNCENKSLLEPKIGVTSLRTVRCGGLPNRYVEREAFSPQAACEKLEVDSRCDAVVIGLAYLLPALSVAGASLAAP